MLREERAMSKKKVKTILLFFFLFFGVLLPRKEVNAAEKKTYSLDQGNIVISKSGDYTISGTTKQYTITIKKGVSTNLVFKDITMSLSDYHIAPILIEDGATVNIILQGNNQITNDRGDGIYVKAGGKFIVSKKSTGTLNVTGGYTGSGIGGNGTILIKGGKILATGGEYGCGIGMGTSLKGYEDVRIEAAGNITISGGTVTATGGKGGSAGIGYASSKTSGTIVISGGTVNATSGGAGIGSHNVGSKGNDISIRGGVVTAIGNAYCAGIGDNLTPKGTKVTILGGTVTATGDCGTVLYDVWTYSNYPLTRKQTTSYDISAEKIVMSGGLIHVDTCSVQPVNQSKQPLYHALLQGENGKVTKIVVNGKEYGCNNIISKGILSFWLPETKDWNRTYLTVTYESGKKTTLSYLNTHQVIQSGSPAKNVEFDISKSSLVIYSNGCIYNNKLYTWYPNSSQYPYSLNSNSITLTGSTTKHQVIVNSGSYDMELKDVSINYEVMENRCFFQVKDSANVNLELTGKNEITTGESSIGFYIGTNGKLAFLSEDTTNSLTINSSISSYGIMTSKGVVAQYGGTLTLNAKESSIGMYLGNAGEFVLYSGNLKGDGGDKNVIYGLNACKISVHGGTLEADNIGYEEEGNEEVQDWSHFYITNGVVNVSNRMIFGSFFVTGGTVNTHLLGSGSGTAVLMYGGEVHMDQFITDYLNWYSNDSRSEGGFQYKTPDGVSKESALNMDYIMGGKVIETHNVTIEELEKILFGRC